MVVPKLDGGCAAANFLKAKRLLANAEKNFSIAMRNLATAKEKLSAARMNVSEEPIL
jgi:hypothetical protein